MPSFKFTSSSVSGHTTHIEYQSDHGTETMWNSHMIKDAVLNLIAAADFSKWDSEDEELSSADFIKQIITALADCWYQEDLEAPESSTVKEQLLSMIDALELDKVTLTLGDDSE